MRFIISPAKKMNECPDLLEWKDLPLFLEEARALADWLGSLPYPEAKKLWQCNEKIAELNFQRFSRMDLTGISRLPFSLMRASSINTWRPRCLPSRDGPMSRSIFESFPVFTGYCAPWTGLCPTGWKCRPKQAGPRFPAVLCPGCLLPACMISGAGNFSMRFRMRAGSSEPGFPGIFPALEPWLTPSDTFITFVFGEWKRWKNYPEGHPGQDGRGEMVRFPGRNPGRPPGGGQAV